MTFYGICSIIVEGAWCVLIVYWIISAIHAKKSVRGGYGIWGILLRILIIPVIAIGIIEHAASLRGVYLQSNFVSNSAVLVLGTIFSLLGIAFAIWARTYLGRNWGMPQTLRQDPELVTGGPYRYVRHPIYTGVMLAMLGSAIVISTGWIFLLVIFSIYFVLSALREEKDMLKLFPDTYPEYKKHTKMLIPFIF